MKRVKPAERNARPLQVISIVGIRYEVKAANDTWVVNQRPPKGIPSKPVQYQAGKGQYLGYQRKISAFVWLDDQVAANTPEWTACPR